MKFEQWNKFQPGDWQKEINVRDFIQRNYTPYEGDSSFLKGTTEKTQKLWDEVLELYKKEKESKGGVLDIDTKTREFDSFEIKKSLKALRMLIFFVKFLYFC